MKQTLFKSLFLIAALTISSNALAEIASGTSGTCTWVISDDGVLTISPTDDVSGTLEDNSSNSGAKWYSYAETIKSVIVEKGVATGKKARYLFSGLSNCSNMDMKYLDVSQATDISRIFYKSSSIISLDLSKWDVSNVTDLTATFSNCSSLKSLNVSNWNVSNVTSLNSTFGGCRSLISLDVSKWNVGKVTDLIYTFGGCSSLTSLEISGWDVSNVTDLWQLFVGCSSLTFLDLSKWDVGKVTSLQGVFYNCSSLTSLNINEWDISNVTSLQSTFHNCSSLTSLNLANWDVSQVTSFYQTFWGCSSLTMLDLSGWNNTKGYWGYALNTCRNLETLKTPTNIGSKEITLPYVMYDWDDNNAEYKKLPGGSLTLHKTKMEDSAVESINAESSVRERMRYDAVGRKIGGVKRGLNIIKMSDGTTRKVVER